MSITTIVALLIAFVLAIYFGQKLIFSIAHKRLSDKQKLISYHKRLHVAVGQLLARANEIDERSHFLATKQSNSWSKQLADACDQLVGLSSALKELEGERQELGQARNNLLRAVVVAKTIESSLKQLEDKLKPVEKVEDN